MFTPAGLGPLIQMHDRGNANVYQNLLQSPDLISIENLWKILGDKVMCNKPTTVTKLWKKSGQR